MGCFPRRRPEQHHAIPVRPVAPDPAREDKGEGVGVTDGKGAMNDDINSLSYRSATNDVTVVELGDVSAVALEAGCWGYEVGEPVEVHLVPGRKGVVVAIGASEFAREPGIDLGMSFPYCQGRGDVLGQTDDGA